jgi:carboxymethylenebutenolidase
MVPDGLGRRPLFDEMGEHLAGFGYVTLVPDVYYRSAPWAPFDASTVFGDEIERPRVMSMIHSVTAADIASDARAYADYLIARPETGDGPIGATGYCAGGRLSLIVAVKLGDTIGAAASFHGGGLASIDDPDSPHRDANAISAVIYVAGAIDDPSFTDDQKELLEQALTDAGVTHTIETYPAAHGFAVSDNPSYDASAAARHWHALAALYEESLTAR